MADLDVTRDGAVAILTMNRPDARNALSAEMVDALSSTLHALEVDDSVRAVVLRGEGDHFMAGGDVKSFMEIGQSDMDPRSLILHRIHHLHPVAGNIDRRVVSRQGKHALLSQGDQHYPR